MSQRALGTSLAAVGAVALGTLAWGTLIERNRFTLRQETLPVLEQGARPLTVLHLSDFHMAPWQRDKQEWIRTLADFEPDLVVNTGDNLGHEGGIEGVEYALEPFRGIPGVYVNGSNDYYAPSFKSPLAYFSGPTGMRANPASPGHSQAVTTITWHRPSPVSFPCAPWVLAKFSTALFRLPGATARPCSARP